ncbi:response regulator transcription factor [Microbacterium sp. BH-3-3-3]|uniref:response regulator transcription factor n=1 Tax=Microbacterium sp. BH-3-3-3 TaxID=1906742 RepID=UPI0011A8EDF2|nr:response regulator [Microbacterium sp. BH-3-3-3]
MSATRTTVVIEDDLDIRLLVSTVLEGAGFVVHAAATGLDGIELVRRHDPSVVTLDVSMPGIDGFETARRIRAFSTTRILMVSARADDAEQRAGREAGADDYLTKPFRPRELRQRVESLFAASA